MIRAISVLLPAQTTRSRLGWRTLLKVSLAAGLGGIVLAGCTPTGTPAPYTQEELKARCESRGGRWHNGDPMRSYCEYGTMK